MRRYIAISCLVALFSSCASQPTIRTEIVYPPLPPPLILPSLQPDKNDKTGTKGYWMDPQDMRKTAKTAADLEVLRKETNAAKGSP